MWLDEADGFAEIFKGYLPYYLLVALPIFIIMSPVNPVAASHEFSVYRMQQYDLHTVPHGCRSASFNLEGRSLNSWSTSRHCVVARVQDITIEQFMEVRSKAGALLLVLPKNDTVLTPEEKEHIQLLEMAMIQQEINPPVYFAKWTPEFEDILKDLQHSFITDDKSGTALEAMFNTVSSNGYQIVVSASAPQKMDSKPVTIHGKLVGRSGAAQTIVIAAHYDAAGLVPELSHGADSNASGAVAILELARIFSRLYSTAAVRGGPSLVFVLTSVGHTLNYFSTKKWLEEQLDSTDASLLQEVSFVLCLDSISSPQLNLHVSKPPKPGGAANSLRARLDVPVVHKKINLADELLAWHHERFSIRRMTAFTLSSLQSHKEAARSSILDAPSESSLRDLTTNVARLARALASHIYNLTNEDNDEDGALYDEALAVEEDSIRHWYEYLSSQPRAPQIITTIPPNTGVTGALERALSRYMDVTVTTHAVDKREPEFVLYSPVRALLYVYSVKPAVFDLILTLAIVAYLSVVYFAIQLFPRFYEEYAKIVTGKSKIN
ncbi:BOS complex subunit ncln [Battus philenor]|uniref:BOS complex subunit ncln n=1 Tax=Battus philenor TaxID=42288 RepID=UPI0035D06C3E